MAAKKKASRPKVTDKDVEKYIEKKIKNFAGKLENMDCSQKPKKICHSSCGGGFYGLGLIGAAIYFISTATSFWGGVVGFLKAIVWPVFMVYGLLKFLGL